MPTDEERALDSPGAMRRALIVIVELVVVLREDPRVQQAYRDCLAHFASSPASPADDLAWGLRRFSGLVREELRTHPWLVKDLWVDFTQQMKQAHGGLGPSGWSLDFSEPMGGRGPKRGEKQGDNYLRRDAEWWYRVNIRKERRDNPYQIAREYEEQTGRDCEDVRRDVIRVLKRTDRLLSAVN